MYHFASTRHPHTHTAPPPLSSHSSNYLLAKTKTRLGGTTLNYSGAVTSARNSRTSAATAHPVVCLLPHSQPYEYVAADAVFFSSPLCVSVFTSFLRPFFSYFMFSHLSFPPPSHLFLLLSFAIFQGLPAVGRTHLSRFNITYTILPSATPPLPKRPSS